IFGGLHAAYYSRGRTGDTGQLRGSNSTRNCRTEASRALDLPQTDSGVSEGNRVDRGTRRIELLNDRYRSFGRLLLADFYWQRFLMSEQSDDSSPCLQTDQEARDGSQVCAELQYSAVSWLGHA